MKSENLSQACKRYNFWEYFTRIVSLTKYVSIKSTIVYVPSSSELGLSQLLSRQRVCPSPQNREGGGSLVCGWGVGGVPISTIWEKAWHSAYSVVSLYGRCVSGERTDRLYTTHLFHYLWTMPSERKPMRSYVQSRYFSAGYEGKNQILEVSRTQHGIESAMSHKMLIFKAGIALLSQSSPPESIPRRNWLLARNRFCGIDAWCP